MGRVAETREALEINDLSTENAGWIAAATKNKAPFGIVAECGRFRREPS